MMDDEREIDATGRIGAPKKKLVEFNPPEKLKLVGDSGEALARWRKKPDGKVCIVSMDGVSLTGDDGPESDAKDYAA